MSEEGGDDWAGGSLDPFDAALVFCAVALGVVVSLVVMVWMLVRVGDIGVAGVVVAGVVMVPIQLLLLVGRVVRLRAVGDWRATVGKPLVVRLFRVFLIGVVWPMWIRRL